MRITKAYLEQSLKYARDLAFADGVKVGRKQAEDEIRIAERKTNIELVRGLGQMAEATARAIITTIGEGGLRG